MAQLGIDQLVTASSAEQVKASLYTIANSLGLNTTAWVPGAKSRTILAIVAQVLSGYTHLAVVIAQSGFLDKAEGPWLILLAILVYGVTPVEATRATGEATINNNGGGDYTSPGFDEGDVVFLNTTTGKTYVNSAPFTLGPLETGKVVPLVAQEFGSESNAAPGEIDDFVTKLLDVTVTNAGPIVGLDAESPSSVKERCRDSLGALSPNGPRASYEYVCKTPSLNGGVAVTRVKKLPPPGNGTITILIAGPAGALGGSDVDLVQAGVDANATPDVVTAFVESADDLPLTYGVTLHVSTEANLLDADWIALAKAAVVEYVNGAEDSTGLPIGGLVLPPAVDGVVPWRGVVGALEAIRVSDTPGYVLQAKLDAEVDVAVAATEVAGITEGDVAVTIVQVSP